MDLDKIDQHVPLAAVQFAAGFKLLDKFKTQWAELHNLSELNVRNTHLALHKLQRIETICSKQLEALEAFSLGFKSLGKLNEQINNIQNDLETLQNSFVLIERNLTLLRCEKEKRDCETFIRNTEGNNEALMQRERIQSEIRRDRLMSEHLKRVQDFEREQQREMEERRIVLEKQFEEEKTLYLKRQ